MPARSPTLPLTVVEWQLSERLFHRPPVLTAVDNPYSNSPYGVTISEWFPQREPALLSSLSARPPRASVFRASGQPLAYGKQAVRSKTHVTMPRRTALSSSTTDLDCWATMQ